VSAKPTIERLLVPKDPVATQTPLDVTPWAARAAAPPSVAQPSEMATVSEDIHHRLRYDARSLPSKTAP